ncbi:MAG: AraC family transcriptional regulator [Pseudomonadota bacterium]
MTSIAAMLPAGAVLPRHQHATPYVTLILRGTYVEAGDHGRFVVGPGDVLVHGQYASHANWTHAQSDVETLNFEVSETPHAPPLSTTTDVDEVVRLSVSDRTAAKTALLNAMTPKTPPLTDWPDIIASAIRDDPAKPVSYWGQSLGLAPGTVSRGFKRAFGVSAAKYRATARARQAYEALLHSDRALIDIADQYRFSDQAHFTRAIRALTGVPPSHWRRVKNLQDAAATAH